MHVAIAITVFDRLVARIADIHRMDRKPEYIAVTPDEWVELSGDRRALPYLDYPFSRASLTSPLDAVKFKVRRFPTTRAGRGDHYTVAESGSFQGIPLFVVPDNCSLVAL